MAIDFIDGFETEVLSVDDKVGIFSGTIVPDETVIVNAPIGSRYYQTNSDAYKKTGSGDTAPNWTLITETTGGGTDTLISLEFFRDSDSSDYWMSRGDNSTRSNQVPFVSPWDLELVGLAFSNEEDNVDVDVELYSVNEGDGSSPKVLEFTWSLVDVRVARKTNFSGSVIIEAGDKLGIFLKDTGKNPDEPVLNTFWKIISTATSESSENYSTNMSTNLTSTS